MATPLPGVRVPVVSETTATGTTAALYEEIRTRLGLGLVPDVFKLVSTRPAYLQVFWDGYRSVFHEGVLERGVKELIAAFVAREVACRYCVDAHVLFLDLIGADPGLTASLAVPDIDDMPIPEPTRELLRLAARITHEAYRIADEDFVRLRALGWSDEQILEAVWTACQFNWVARMANTFGLTTLGQLAD
ncbi:carboxymuconolactone decarboxylase family protein [Streptosporangium sp. NPDC050855]|uniref:carboxymuconolactone decarboxylase family protein n=1 Tax=Streptosporangium sp. NPDC050855 TaxID=3366194 RepID=UPI00379CEE85